MKRQQYLKAVRTHIAITSLAALLFAGVAVADGNHNTKVTVINDAKREIEVATYNAGDAWTVTPHKKYWIGENQSAKVKAHGGPTKHIILLIQPRGRSFMNCIDTNGYGWNRKNAKNNTTITIDYCK